MKNVLVLGAGLVSRPLVHYLLDQKNIHVLMASRTKEKAEKTVGDHPHGEARQVDVSDSKKVDSLVSEGDIVVSLLPYTYHVPIAKMCLTHGKHLVTTSYVSDEMQMLDTRARDADLIFLNEIGLDPGIDHMSAMKIIHNIHEGGGDAISFTSYCGVLPAPEANTNPFGYKFSWSPRGVLLASRNSAQFLKEGKEINIPGEKLFETYTYQCIPRVGFFEGYPNRNSLSYREKYGIPEVKTLLRGTLRYNGWCELMKTLVDIGFLDITEHPKIKGMTYRQLLATLIGRAGTNVKQELADHLGIAPYSAVMKKIEWLGLLDNNPLPPNLSIPLDILVERMKERLDYAPGERDMAVLHHEFLGDFHGETKQVTSTFIDYGIPHGDTAVARTVALPAAIGTKLILNGKISLRGVHIPIHPEIYNPVLTELTGLGVTFTEETRVLPH